MSRLFDQQGRPLALGKKLGQGGEGAVYEISGQPSYVGKIYSKPVDAEKSQKLACMLSFDSSSLRSFAAWPTAVLHNRVNGPAVGILMPRMQNKHEIHQLYSPTERKQRFPSQDWRFLVRVARNCAANVAALHDLGIVIGDINQGNFFATDRAIVQIIDCDSFQITKNSRTYRCQVGVRDFTPPELQGMNLGSVDRTANHDNFGLAILIFQLLFMGRHPFVGRYQGKGDMPIEKAIAEHRFAYGRHSQRYGMKPPPNSLTLTDVSTEISDLFERAFAPNAKHAGRPSARAWALSLEKFEKELTECPVDARHYYYSSNQEIWGFQLGSKNKCSWCNILDKGGPNFFVSDIAPNSVVPAQAFELSNVWDAIRTVDQPNSLPTFATGIQATAVIPEQFSLGEDELGFFRSMVLGVSIASLIASLLGLLNSYVFCFSIPLFLAFLGWYVGLLWLRPLGKLKMKLRKNLLFAKGRLKVHMLSIDMAISSAQRVFDAKLNHFSGLVNRYSSLDQEESKRLAELGRDAKAAQFRHFLESKSIFDADIHGIGRTRKIALASFGIDSAADIDPYRVLMVPGFGDSLTASLVVWRDMVASEFKFDVKKGVPQAARMKLRGEINQKRRVIQHELSHAVGLLKKITSDCARKLAPLRRELGPIEREVNQAQANLDNVA